MDLATIDSTTVNDHAARSRHLEPWLWLALIVTLVAAIWIQYDRLREPYSVEEDARSFAWWHRLQDHELFKDDLLYQSTVQDLEIGPWIFVVYKPSPGYSLLFQLASHVVPPILFSKLLIFPALLSAVYFLYGIGRRISGPRTAFALCLAYVIFNLASPMAISASGGLQRSFMLPFLLAATFYLMQERYRAAAVVIFLSGTIYAPAFVLGAATYWLLLVQPQAKSWHNILDWRQLPPLLIAVMLVGLILTPALADQLNPNGQQENETAQMDLLSDPKFQAGGRRQLFEHFPLVGRGGMATDTSNVLHITLLSILGTITWISYPNSLGRFSYVLKLLFLASFICFALAWAVALITSGFPLYLPSRYTQASVPLFLLIYVMVNVEETLRRVTTWLYTQRAKSFLLLIPTSLLAAGVALFAPQAQEGFQSAFIFRYRKPLLLSLSAFLLLLGLLSALRERHMVGDERMVEQPALSSRAAVIFGLALLVPSLWYVWAFHPVFHVANPAERQLYQYLETLPKDVRIGGDPQALSSVPIFAKRAILFSEEDPHPDDDVMMDAMQAYYSESAADVAAFCRRYGVDYLLVDGDDFGAERIARGNFLFEPYDSELRRELETRTHFALADVTHAAIRFQVDRLTVVACQEVAR